MDEMKWYGKVEKKRWYGGRMPGRKSKALVVRVESGEPQIFEMRVDDVPGDFIAVVSDGNGSGDYYVSKSRADLVNFMKEYAADQTVVGWERYLVVEYSATAVEDSNDYDLDAEIEVKRARKKQSPQLDMVRTIQLDYDVWDYSTNAFTKPASGSWDRGPRQELRRRKVYSPEDGDESRTGSPEWSGDDKPPRGAVPYSAERVAVIEEIQRALGKLDARMREFLGGDPKQLAKKLDAAIGDASRLLGDGTTPSKRRQA
jgi:hypothetical protein